MQLSPTQQAALKDWLATNASGISDDAAAVQLNAIASPDYYVWRTIVSRDEVQGDLAFDWTRVDNLSVGKARIWDYMFNKVDAIRPARANVRTGIQAVWVGTQADLAVRAAVEGVCKRKVTVFEKLFVTQTTGGPSQSGNRGATTNPDTLGTGVDGGILEGLVPAQLIAENR